MDDGLAWHPSALRGTELCRVMTHHNKKIHWLLGSAYGTKQIEVHRGHHLLD